jgi:hypothetical protein
MNGRSSCVALSSMLPNLPGTPLSISIAKSFVE